MKIFLRRLFKTLGVLALLLVLLHLIENWRGERAWQAWKASREAMGERFDLDSLLPPPVPDAENFATAPVVAEAVAGKAESPNPAKPFQDDPKFSGNWREGRRADLAAWQASTKEDLEAVLAPYGPRLEALAEAAQRPHSRLRIDYKNLDQVPMLLGFRQSARVLRTRAQMSLSQGKPEAALEDVLTGLGIVKHLQLEPDLISQLLRMATAGIMLQPVWEGLRDHRWNEAQLVRLQGALEQVDLVDSLRRAWMWERNSFGDRILDPKRGLRKDLNRLVFPQGWIYQNMLRHDQFFAEHMVDVLDVPQHLIRVSRKAEPQAQPRRGPYNFMLFVEVPTLLIQNVRMARIQSGLDQATVACALERHRQAQHGYPETLAALVPIYLAKLPHDVVEGRPLRYQRIDGDAYRLYALGWDGKDDGGRVEPAKPGDTNDMAQGDWVWSMGH